MFSFGRGYKKSTVEDDGFDGRVCGRRRWQGGCPQEGSGPCRHPGAAVRNRRLCGLGNLPSVEPPSISPPPVCGVENLSAFFRDKKINKKEVLAQFFVNPHSTGFPCPPLVCNTDAGGEDTISTATARITIRTKNYWETFKKAWKFLPQTSLTTQRNQTEHCGRKKKQIPTRFGTLQKNLENDTSHHEISKKKKYKKKKITI